MQEKVKSFLGSKIGLVLMLLSLLVIYHLTFGERGIKKVGIVQMNKLVYEYQGMKDATEMYTGKMTKWSAQGDSIKKILENYLYDIKMDSINNDKVKLKMDQQKFMLLKGKYIEYQQKAEATSQEEDQKMTVGVINQLKGHMKNYAEENDFDLIITNGQTENVGFVKEKFDITEDLLNYSNSKYQDEK